MHNRSDFETRGMILDDVWVTFQNMVAEAVLFMAENNNEVDYPRSTGSVRGKALGLGLALGFKSFDVAEFMNHWTDRKRRTPVFNASDIRLALQHEASHWRA